MPRSELRLQTPIPAPSSPTFIPSTPGPEKFCGPFPDAAAPVHLPKPNFSRKINMTSQNQEDVFEDVLNLEDQYYREGYDLGVVDSSKSSYIKGRVFGLEKGFEKFLEMGKLNGKAAVWEAQLLQSEEIAKNDLRVLDLGGSERLRKHIERLANLTNLGVINTENSEDAISEFENRLKDAKAKATLISKITGEDKVIGSSRGERRKGIRLSRNNNERGIAGRRTSEMEDFVGLPGRS